MKSLHKPGRKFHYLFDANLGKDLDSNYVFKHSCAIHLIWRSPKILLFFFDDVFVAVAKLSKQKVGMLNLQIFFKSACYERYLFSNVLLNLSVWLSFNCSFLNYSVAIWNFLNVNKSESIWHKPNFKMTESSNIKAILHVTMMQGWRITGE